LVGLENRAILIEYLSFLLEKDLGFLTYEPECFPVMETKWKSPSLITNAIIDFADTSNHDINKIAFELSLLGCIAVELRVYYRATAYYIESILKAFDQTRIRSIELVTTFTEELTAEYLSSISSEYQRLTSIVVTSSPTSESITVNSHFENIHYVTQSVESSACCVSVISRAHFPQAKLLEQNQSFAFRLT
jgi:hypothetical protein